MGIVEFLTARLDDDEASLDEPDPEMEEWALQSADLNEGALVWYDRRLRADIAAKRVIVDVAGGYTTGWPATDNDADTQMADILGALASVYADHPDYQQEWE
jgi:hypothetical protein